MVQEVVAATAAPLISHDHAELVFLRPCKIGFLQANWLSSCEMIVLLLNSRLLNGKASGFLR